MNFEEFTDKVRSVVQTTDTVYKYGYGVSANPKCDEFIKSDTWVTGGTSGGNCWNEGGHYSLDSESEAEFDDLDKVLQEIAPNLTFLQYKMILKRVQRQEGSENEYYGNHTDWAYKYMTLKDLYNSLVELKLI